MTHDERDAQLLGELAALFERTEPVPDLVTRTARASFALRSMDMDLALLTWDSRVDEPEVALRSGPEDDEGRERRELTFERGDLAVEVEVAAPARGWRLLGQLSPAGSARMELHRAPRVSEDPTGDPAESAPEIVPVEVDDLGRFSLGGLPPGLVRLVVHRDGERPTATDWFRID